jgi:hypothetical protein
VWCVWCVVCVVVWCVVCVVCGGVCGVVCCVCVCGVWCVDGPIMLQGGLQVHSGASDCRGGGARQGVLSQRRQNVDV